MRLSKAEQQAIISTVGRFLECSYQLYLYGSRTIETERGGDIDLLILLDNDQDVETARKLKIKILVGIKSQIGDQKIDLAIFSNSQLGHEPFLDLIYPTAKLLK